MQEESCAVSNPEAMTVEESHVVANPEAVTVEKEDPGDRPCLAGAKLNLIKR